MEMTHYMELMMGSWHMLVLFMAAPMLLAECYVVSEILLLIKPRQGDALAAFNKASAYAAALGIALLSGCVALQFSSVVAWRTWVDAVSALAYVAAGLPFIYVGLNDKLNVITKDGKLIPGLYAAGELVGGVMGDDSPAGANVGWALTSGRVAADAIKEAVAK